MWNSSQVLATGIYTSTSVNPLTSLHYKFIIVCASLFCLVLIPLQVNIKLLHGAAGSVL